MYIHFSVWTYLPCHKEESTFLLSCIVNAMADFALFEHQLFRLFMYVSIPKGQSIWTIEGPALLRLWFSAIKWLLLTGRIGYSNVRVFFSATRGECPAGQRLKHQNETSSKVHPGNKIVKDEVRVLFFFNTSFPARNWNLFEVDAAESNFWACKKCDIIEDRANRKRTCL